MTRTQRQIDEHRQGEAYIEVRDSAGRPWAGVPVWAEQETHAFAFGYVGLDLKALPELERQGYTARISEVFNRLIPAGRTPEPGTIRIGVPNGVHLGRFRLDLDRTAAAGSPLAVFVNARSVGLSAEDNRAAAERLAALYTLCFAHPAVHAILWDGEAGATGGGLLRLDGGPRLAFRFLHKLIGTSWHSRARGETGADGRFRFQGFFGDYRLAARPGTAAATVAVLPFRAGAGASPFLLHIPDASRPESRADCS